MNKIKQIMREYTRKYHLIIFTFKQIWKFEGKKNDLHQKKEEYFRE